MVTSDRFDTPHTKGTYCLIMHAARPANLAIGKLGAFRFAAGYYAYAGSAFGPGGLAARIRHHLKPAQRPHWHIDYLRVVARIVEIWFDSNKVEHIWAESLSKLAGAQKPVKGFGCTDCRCDTHLFFYAVRPDFSVFKRLLHRRELL